MKPKRNMKLNYKPWALGKKYKKGEFPILDIQLGGECNLGCVYCDTPKYNATCETSIDDMIKLLSTKYLEWVYICGLGEPTVGKNMRYLKEILKYSKDNNIGVSIFSNIVNLDDELLQYIDDQVLNVLFKLDSFVPEKIEKLYNTDKSRQIHNNISKLIEVVHCKDGITNLGASIVPTTVNQDEISSIIDFCMKNNIFPLVGELETAGKGTEVFDELNISKEKLIEIKNKLSDVMGVEYVTPICPATLSSIHLNNKGEVIVDERTGFSCPWFWLDEPKIHTIGNSRDLSFENISNAIVEYRDSKISCVEDALNGENKNLIGGCGGDVKKLMKTYLENNGI